MQLRDAVGHCSTAMIDSYEGPPTLSLFYVLGICPRWSRTLDFEQKPLYSAPRACLEKQLNNSTRNIQSYLPLIGPLAEGLSRGY